MLESVMESREWSIRSDGSIIECTIDAYNNLGNNLRNLPNKQRDQFLKEQLLQFINAIKTA